MIPTSSMQPMVPSQAPGQIQFSGKLDKLNPKNWVTKEVPDDSFSSSSDGPAKTRRELSIGRSIATGLVALTTLIAPFALFDKVGSTEACAITNNVTGNVRSADPGLAFRPWLLADSTCFTTADPRVTETSYIGGDQATRSTRSVENIYVNAPVSLAWQPNAENIAKVFTDVYGPGGTDDADLKPSRDQIVDEENEVLWENALYSEFRGMRDEIISLIPVTQLNSLAAKNAVRNAILHGYDPQQLYSQFEAYQFHQEGEEGGTNPAATSLIASGRQPSLQDRITDRYGAELIQITDAELRDTQILDAEINSALQELGRYPILIQRAEQQEQLNTENAQADAAAAEGRKNVQRIDAESAAAVLGIQADAEANQIETIAEALRAHPEMIQKILAEAQLAAGENGGLIITDGEQEIILNAPNRGGNGG